MADAQKKIQEDRQKEVTKELCRAALLYSELNPERAKHLIPAWFKSFFISKEHCGHTMKWTAIYGAGAYIALVLVLGGIISWYYTPNTITLKTPGTRNASEINNPASLLLPVVERK